MRFQPIRSFEWNEQFKKRGGAGAPNLDTLPTPLSDESTPTPPLRNVVLNNIEHRNNSVERRFTHSL